MRKLLKSSLCAVISLILIFSLASTSIFAADISSKKIITLSAVDGVDISVRLQKALNLASQTGTDDEPCKIIIPAGTYYLDNSVNIYSNTIISAYGAHIINTHNGCMLMCGNMYDGIDEGVDGYNGFRNISLEGGNWDGNCFNSTANEFCNLRFAHITNLTLTDVSVTNNVGSHHLEIGGADNVVVTGCTFSGYTKLCKEAIQLDVMHSIAFFNRYPKYDDTTCQNVYIYNNVFENLPRVIGSHNAVNGKYHNNIYFYNNICKNIDNKAVVCYNWINSKIYLNQFENVAAGIEFRFMDAINYHNPTELATDVKILEESNSSIFCNTFTLKKFSSSSLTTTFGIRVGGGDITDEYNPNEIQTGVYKIKSVIVKGNQLKGYSKFPIRLEYADNCTVTQNTVDSSGVTNDLEKARSVSLAYSSNNIISENTLKNLPNADANSIQIEYSSNNNSITNNTITDIGKSGISIYNADNNVVENCNISNCKHIGIAISNKSNNNTAKSNSVSNCSDNGISSNDANNSTITNCNVSTSSKKGISITSSKNVVLTSNTIKNCSSYGIYLCNNSSAKDISKNNLISNGNKYAIYITDDSTSPTPSLYKTSTYSDVTTYNCISGVAVSASTVTIYNGNTSIGTTKSDNLGYFYAVYSQPSKSVSLTATAKDKKNNVSTASFKYSLVLPTSVSLNKTSITLGLNESYNLKATLKPSNAYDTLKWSSSNKSVVTVSNGKITAKAIGTAYITVYTSNNKYATCTVTVKKAPSSISLNKTKLTLGIGEQYDLNSSLPSGTASYSIKYSSSNTNVASVKEGGGIVTARSVGTAIITAKTFNGKTVNCIVTVKNAPKAISLNKTSLTLKVGQTYDLNSYLPSDTASYSIKYSSSNTKVATVKQSGGIVTAKSRGKTTITATTYNNITAKCNVTVI